MKAELTAENRPACVSASSVPVFSTDHRDEATDEYEGRVQILVILFRIITIKLARLPPIYGEEVGSGIVGP